MKNQKGNIVTIALIYIALFMAVVMLLIAIVLGSVNGMIHSVKTDMYLINKSAILAVNQNKASRDYFSYHKKDFEKYFKEALQKNYSLNQSLENPDGLLQKVSIQEYEVYRANQKDHFTGNKVNDRVIHCVIQVQMKPVILENQLQSLFTFQVHEDVKLAPYETGKGE